MCGDSLGLGSRVLLSLVGRLSFHGGQACICKVILLGAGVLCSSTGGGRLSFSEGEVYVHKVILSGSKAG